MSDEALKAAGIHLSKIRLSIELEDSHDFIHDLDRELAAEAMARPMQISVKGRMAFLYTDGKPFDRQLPIVLFMHCVQLDHS